jgi:hypothetical protein
MPDPEVSKVLGGFMLTEEQRKNAKKLRSMVISKINQPTHHLETLFNVKHLSYADLQEIYHYINAVIMFNTIPVHRHLTKKAKEVIAKAGVY